MGSRISLLFMRSFKHACSEILGDDSWDTILFSWCIKTPNFWRYITADPASTLLQLHLRAWCLLWGVRSRLLSCLKPGPNLEPYNWIKHGNDLISDSVTIGHWGLLSVWTVKKCSHCNGELIQRNPGISPFPRFSSAMVLILLGRACFKFVQSKNIELTTCISIIGISALTLTLVIHIRWKLIEKTFRICTRCGSKTGFGNK